MIRKFADDYLAISGTLTDRRAAEMRAARGQEAGGSREAPQPSAGVKRQSANVSKLPLSASPAWELDFEPATRRRFHPA